MAYKDLEEEMAFERGQLKTSDPVWTSTNEDEDEDLPLDLSSSSSKWSAVQEEVEDGGDGSSERDSNSSSCNESTPSRGQREFSIPGILDESQLHFFSLDHEK